jgi:hypothetical protein
MKSLNYARSFERILATLGKAYSNVRFLRDALYFGRGLLALQDWLAINSPSKG